MAAEAQRQQDGVRAADLASGRRASAADTAPSPPVSDPRTTAGASEPAQPGSMGVSVDGVAATDAAPPAGQPGFGFARRHGLLLADEAPGEPARVLCRPDVRPAAVMELRRALGRALQLERIDPDTFDRLLRDRYERRGNEAMQLAEGLDDSADLRSVADSLAEPEDLLEAEDDAPIIRLINALLTEAIQQGASDIHIEAFENRLSVRFRVDGVLREILEPPRALAPLITSRIKVMARLDIAEKRLPQDGRISLRIAGRAVDVRVSTLPSGHGERVVMRLLDKQAGRLELDALGLAPPAQAQLASLLQRPHGILLVTGPTGSGKTTTLYAGLGRLNDRKRNILTVEDPIEYYLDGVGQTQVNTKVDMTFARGLRAILRQDPDVVMIGEIRDLETAQIAVQASLTGHLVLSTLHTNTAVGAVTRLRDMGVEPFLLSSSLLGIIAQRLVRLLCTDCRQPYRADDSECRVLGLTTAAAPMLYRPQGCASCNHLGYRGRTGIYELVGVDEPLRGLIHDGAGEQAMERHARVTQPGIRQDGFRRVLAGETSLDEVLRVTREDAALVSDSDGVRLAGI